MPKKNNTLYALAVEKFGQNHQLGLAMEEGAEFIQAVNKVMRYGVNITTLEALAGEVADLQIMNEQIVQMFKEHDFEEMVEHAKCKKLVRLDSILSDIPLTI